MRWPSGLPQQDRSCRSWPEMGAKMMPRNPAPSKAISGIDAWPARSSFRAIPSLQAMTPVAHEK
jgi:hypothetical protein